MGDVTRHIGFFVTDFWTFTCLEISYFLIIKKDKNSPTALLPWEHAENKTPEPRVHPGVEWMWENVLTQLIKKQTEPEPRTIQRPGLVVEAGHSAGAIRQPGPPRLLDVTLHPCHCSQLSSSWAFGREGDTAG